MTHAKPIYKRGDVVLVLFPDSSLCTAKPRPALVVQADLLQSSILIQVTASKNAK
ncbi:MAG: hypothetical protein C4527_14515 [Candidatus Omnitrophota bacterium]|nr:MAG: hypothetical protein C4527_14515 [Candidatus Omnitrophota bacterium]